MGISQADTYIKVRLDRGVFNELEAFSQLRNIPKSTIASIGIKQLLENDQRWKMRQSFYTRDVKPTQTPIVGSKVQVAFENIGAPHFAYLREAIVLNVTDHSFKFMIEITDGPPYATVHGENMDLGSGYLTEPEAVEGNRGVFELPNEYVW